MKKILITGAKSYIGQSFEKWLEKWPEDYQIDTENVVNDNWKEKSFSGYDVVFNVAGIVHRKEQPKMEQFYINVNCNLAVALAKKAKADGVKQFVFMSTKGVYLPNTPSISLLTIPHPSKLYGKSKLMAENELLKLCSDSFIVSIIRAPTVYGKGCSGNYTKLSKFIKRVPVFPDIRSRRSMIYISNLCEFIRITIDKKYKGVLFPQNKEFVCTTDMARIIAKIHNKHILFSKLLGFLVLIVMSRIGKLKTMFSDSVYEKSISEYNDFEYCIFNFDESIVLSEAKENKKYSF